MDGIIAWVRNRNKAEEIAAFILNRQFVVFIKKTNSLSKKKYCPQFLLQPRLTYTKLV